MSWHSPIPLYLMSTWMASALIVVQWSLRSIQEQISPECYVHSPVFWVQRGLPTWRPPGENGTVPTFLNRLAATNPRGGMGCFTCTIHQHLGQTSNMPETNLLHLFWATLNGKTEISTPIFRCNNCVGANGIPVEEAMNELGSSTSKKT